MSSKDNIRVIVNHEDKPRCILTVEKKADGNLILALRTASIVYPEDVTYSPNDKINELINEKYSIHVSPRSRHQANLIKRETIPKSGQVLTGVQYTTAIKKDNGFAVVFSRRCPGMLHPVSDLKKSKPNEILLGAYDPIFFSLFFTVLVADKGRTFDPTERGLDINVIQFTANDFNIVILWSFLSVPAYSKGTILHVESPKADGVLHQNGNISIAGIDELEAFSQFRLGRFMLYQDLKTLVLNDPDFDPQFTVPLLNAVFYRTGNGLRDFEHVFSRNYRHTALNAPRLQEHFKKLIFPGAENKINTD